MYMCVQYKVIQCTSLLRKGKFYCLDSKAVKRVACHFLNQYNNFILIVFLVRIKQTFHYLCFHFLCIVYVRLSISFS